MTSTAAVQRSGAETASSVFAHNRGTTQPQETGRSRRRRSRRSRRSNRNPNANYARGTAGQNFLGGQDPSAAAARNNARPALTNTPQSAANLQNFANLQDQALRQALRNATSNKVQLSYKNARRAMFSRVDNMGGSVACVYTGRLVNTQGIPSAQGRQNMNTEHTWPKSKGVRGSPAESDLHHLFPTDTDANSRRGSLPFGEVDQVLWEEHGSKMGLDKNGQTVFEPPNKHKGDVARAMFYVAVRYDKHIDNTEEAVLKKWNKQDPVDGKERARNDQIEVAQGNRNPFIDDESLPDRISDF